MLITYHSKHLHLLSCPSNYVDQKDLQVLPRPRKSKVDREYRRFEQNSVLICGNSHQLAKKSHLGK